MWFKGDVVGDERNSRKIISTELKSAIEAPCCLLLKNACFRFFQRSGSQICVKHQMSFWSVLEGWAKSDSSGILEESQKRAFEKLKKNDICI